jgi:hypothetical protein
VGCGAARHLGAAWLGVGGWVWSLDRYSSVRWLVGWLCVCMSVLGCLGVVLW